MKIHGDCFWTRRSPWSIGDGPEESRSTHEGGAMPYPPGRAPLPRGRLVASLTSTPSLLDCVCSKKDHREGFIPFGIPFLQNTEIGKKQKLALGLRLIG